METSSSSPSNSLRTLVLQALPEHPGDIVRADSRGAALGRSYLETLRACLGQLSTSAALQAAISAARAEAPLSPALQHEAWSHYLIVWTLRTLWRDSLRLRAAEQHEAAGQLAQIVSELLHASTKLPRAEAPARSQILLPLETLVQRGREALAHVHSASLLSASEREWSAHFLHQLAHSLALMASGDARVDGLTRGAITRTERRFKDDAGLTTVLDRKTLAALCLFEAAAALADEMPAVEGLRDWPLDACAWFSSTALRIAQCALQLEAWMPAPLPKAPTPTVSSPATASLHTHKISDRSEKKDIPMPALETQSFPRKVLQTLEGDAREAAWRTAGSQFVKLTREPLVALLSRHLGPNDESLRLRLAQFLETELGTALLASLLSVALSAMPSTAGEIPQRLGKELRVRAMADTGDLVAELLMGPMRQVISLYLADLGSAAACVEAPTETANLRPPVARVVSIGEREAAVVSG